MDSNIKATGVLVGLALVAHGIYLYFICKATTAQQMCAEYGWSCESCITPVVLEILIGIALFLGMSHPKDPPSGLR